MWTAVTSTATRKQSLITSCVWVFVHSHCLSSKHACSGLGVMQQTYSADTESMQTEQYSACRTPFEDLGDSYRCPQCSAFKKRFAPYDVQTGKVSRPHE